MKNNNSILHPNRHLILLCKGHYYTNNLTPSVMQAALKRVMQADGVKDSDRLDALTKVACEAFEKSDDIRGELKSHIKFICDRFDLQERANGINSVTSFQFRDLIEEAMMVIIARWKLPEDIDIGKPDPRIWAVTSPENIKEKQ